MPMPVPVPRWLLYRLVDVSQTGYRTVVGTWVHPAGYVKPNWPRNDGVIRPHLRDSRTHGMRLCLVAQSVTGAIPTR